MYFGRERIGTIGGGGVDDDNSGGEMESLEEDYMLYRKCVSESLFTFNARPLTFKAPLADKCNLCVWVMPYGHTLVHRWSRMISERLGLYNYISGHMLMQCVCERLITH